MRRVYYCIKPFLPWEVRIAARRILAHRRRKTCRNVWPIAPGSETPPSGWPGWPEGKKFAFVLTHDVEGRLGVERCRQLMELERSLGFRSSFNFVPEGECPIPQELRDELTQNGFEVGVHDLNHDGKLYFSRALFQKRVQRINHYLKEWKSRGFRSAYMLHRTDWMHELDILYDASTFDTDPFEPQPDGAGSIFPLYVPGHNGSQGFVELPYTLVQDFNLFVVLREQGAGIWDQKLAWIAEKGGMALMDTHPDYMALKEAIPSRSEYPIEWYEAFLREVAKRYAGQYWHALPHEVATFVTQRKDALSFQPSSPNSSSRRTGTAARKKIWIDLENTPHIPFFKPIIKELKARGYTIEVTARNAYQTCEMANQCGLTYTRIGHHYGRNRLLKLWGLFIRCLQLVPFIFRERPCLGLNHGARAQIVACKLFGIPSVLIMDYEHSQGLPVFRPRWTIFPDVVVEEHWGSKHQRRMLKYTGIKEDVYVPGFQPDRSILAQLQLENSRLVVTVRPPATEAHYHNPEAEVLFARFMDRVCKVHGARIVLLPRNQAQETQIKAKWPQWFQDSKVVIPHTVVDGLNLLWHSDLVVSGGGTMNREAAALGVPVYSIFRGKIGAVDQSLQARGRLILVQSVEDVDKIRIEPRDKTALPDLRPRQALKDIVNHIEAIMQHHYPDSQPGASKK